MKMAAIGNKKIETSEPKNFFEKNKRVVLILTIFLIISIGLSIILQNNFKHIYEIGLVEQAVWNTINGDFFASISNGSNHFAMHNSPILFLFLPIYYIFENNLIFIILTNLSIVISSFVIYLLGEKILKSKKYALAFMISYLLFPSFLYSNIRSFHPVMLSVSFIAFALFFLYKKKWNYFFWAVILAMLCNETISFLAVMLGVYVLIKHKKRIGLILIIAGLLWFLFSTKVVTAHFSTGDEYQFIGNLYGHLGSSIGEVVGSIIREPLKSFNYGIPEAKINYLKTIFQHNIYFSILAPEIIILSLPVFLQNLFSQSGYNYDIVAHYIYPIIPIIFFASIIGFKRLARRIEKIERIKTMKKIRTNKIKDYLIILILLISIFNGFIYGLNPLLKDSCSAFNTTEKCLTTGDIIGNSPKSNNKIIRDYTDIIGSDNSLMVQNHVFSSVSKRSKTYLLKYFYDCPSADYILIDWQGNIDPINDVEEYYQLLSEKNYKTISKKSEVELFKKNKDDNGC